MCIVQSVQNPILHPGADESGSSESTHYSDLHGGYGQGLNSTLSTGAPSSSYLGATLFEPPLDMPPHLSFYVNGSSLNSFQQGSVPHAISRRVLFCDPASQLEVSTMGSGNVYFSPEEYQDTRTYPAPPALLDAQVMSRSTFHFSELFMVHAIYYTGGPRTDAQHYDRLYATTIRRLLALEG